MTVRPARLAAGVDEAGRGPLAGPVVAAAVILDPERVPDGLADSKALTAARRETLAAVIPRLALASSVAWADREEIDRLNIFQATMLAMRRALMGLSLRPAAVEVDGRHLPRLDLGYPVEGRAIVGGDRKVAAISAASILAKVTRDRMMQVFDEAWPDYGFARHKGYGTREHRACLEALGPCPQHRRSFRPLADILLAGSSQRRRAG